MSDQDRISAFSNQSSDIRQEELTRYRPISRLAVIALIVGLLSWLAVFHNILWLLPVVGIILSMVAIKQTSSADAVATGRTAAILGMGLSILFGVLAVTTAVTEERLVSAQAIEFAEGWLKIVRSGNLLQAAEWVRAPRSRLPYDSDYTKFYEENEDAQSLLKNLTNGAAMKRLLALNDKDQVTFAGIDKRNRTGDIFLFDLRFEMKNKENEISKPLIFSVRRTSEQARARWSMASLSEGK